MLLPTGLFFLEGGKGVVFGLSLRGDLLLATCAGGSNGFRRHPRETQ